jgi:hypothetical protein
MATLHISDDTYERLARKAVAQNTTVEGLLEPLLDRIAEAGPFSPSQTPSPSAAQRKEAFAEWMAQVQHRADRYPPGFLVNDSRESIYEGCGE